MKSMTIIKAIIVCIALIFLYTLIAICFYFSINDSISSSALAWIELGLHIILIGLVLFFLVRIEKIPLKKELFKKRFSMVLFFKIIFITILFLVAYRLLYVELVHLKLMKPLNYETTIHQDFGVVKVLSGFIFSVLLVPVFEEIFFRQYIFGGLLSKYKLVTAVIFSSILFSSMHLPGLFFMSMMFFFGVISALIYYKTGSIVYSMLFHFLWNLIVFSNTMTPNIDLYSYVVSDLNSINLVVGILSILLLFLVIKNIKSPYHSISNETKE